MNVTDLRSQLSEAIESSGKSQAIFAREFGFSFSTLNKFLRGELANPRLSTIIAYERAIERSKRRSAA